ncbi:MAG: hypothetical protein O7H40_12275, partial [Gammaproteobacteria bacterium]|nr:hypothetical protein [Gammaproteobacteria bacterium]
MSGKNARRRKRNRAKASYERRLSGVATTAGVLYALPSVVSAAIVHFSGIPVSIDAKAPDGLIPDPETHTVLFDNAVLWDVDGGGTPDFALRRKGTLYTNPIGTEGSAFTNRYAYGYLMLDSATGGNGVVMVNEGTNPPDPLAIQALQAGTQIGPNLVGTLATGSYRLGSAGQTGRNMMNFISSSLLNYTN